MFNVYTKREVLITRGQAKLEKVGKMYVVSSEPGKTYGITPTRALAEIWFEEIGA